MTSSNPGHKPAELFRSDLISAMKLPDSTPMEPGSFLTIREPWRTEWEFGVQVCVSPTQIPDPQSSCVDDAPKRTEKFELPQSRLTDNRSPTEYPMYDLDELDLNWLDTVNQKRKFRALAGLNGLSEDTLRNALVALETKCQQNMARAVATEESLGIEYDEQTVCDVCQDHEGEESNVMIFCDSCNVCVHQACYGVGSVPKGSWLCKVCASGEESPECVLCFKSGGALKRVRPGNTSWAHISCALWIPEVRLGNVDKMEPITNVEAVPLSRWNLVCCLCRKKQGACVQCCHPSCVMAYHVTCGFKHALIMKSRLDVINNAVIHESFCPKHTALRHSPHFSPLKRRPGALQQPSQLIQLQETFYKYTSPEDLTSELKMTPKLASLIYNYWKLKRRSQHNRTLLSHLPIETSLESVKAELGGGAARYSLQDDEGFVKIVHLRQNLEKARNLIYMVQRRERLKKQLLYNQANHWDTEVQTLDTLPEGSELECDSSVRQTRSMTLRCSNSPVPSDGSSDQRHSAPSGPPEDSASATCTHSHTQPSLTHCPSEAQGPNLHDNEPNHQGCLHGGSSQKLTDTNSLECIGGNSVTRNKLSNGDSSVNGVVVKDTARTKVEGLVLKNCRIPHLRHRPYTVANKAATEPA